MDIQSGYYEAGIVLFWLLFAYLFMDKFLFRGQLGEICFGKARRRMAKALRGVAGWFDPVKEVQKKGRKRTKGKTEKKEIPVVREAEKRDMPAVKTEMKDKEKAEVKEKAEGRNMEKPSQKQPETDSLVVTKSYGTRQQQHPCCDRRRCAGAGRQLRWLHPRYLRQHRAGPPKSSA